MTAEFAPDELYSILEAFRPFLKSIDIRTFAVVSQSDGGWENLVTSLVVSEKTVDEVSRLHDKLPKIRTNQLALFLSAVPFDFSVFEGFCLGDIGQRSITVVGARYAFGNRHIRTSQFNPLKLKVVSSRRRIKGLLSYVLSAVNSNSGSPERERLWSIAQSQTRLPKEFSYGSMDELIRDILETDDLSHTKEFEMKKNVGGEFYWHFKSGNGEIVAVSQAYKSKEGCLNGINSIKRDAVSAIIKDSTL